MLRHPPPHVVSEHLRVLPLLLAGDVPGQEVYLRTDTGLEHGEQDAGHCSVLLVPGPGHGVVSVGVADHDGLDWDTRDEGAWFEC